jgi:hypothetical protein
MNSNYNLNNWEVLGAAKLEKIDDQLLKDETSDKGPVDTSRFGLPRCLASSVLMPSNAVLRVKSANNFIGF